MNTSWKQWRFSADQHSKGAGANAFEVALAVRNLFNSKEFVTEAHNNVLDNSTEELALYCERMGMRLHAMLAMINHFPKKEDWESKSLPSLHEETLHSLSKPYKPGQGKRLKHDELMRRLREENRQLKAENKKLRTAMDKLKRELEAV